MNRQKLYFDSTIKKKNIQIVDSYSVIKDKFEKILN